MYVSISMEICSNEAQIGGFRIARHGLGRVTVSQMFKTILPVIFFMCFMAFFFGDEIRTILNIGLDSPVDTDGQLKNEIRAYIFDPCIEAIYKASELNSFDLDEAQKLSEALMAELFDANMEMHLRQIRSVPRFDNREVYYEVMRQKCIDAGVAAVP